MPISTVTLMAALATSGHRLVAAKDLARHLGADDLVILTRDPEAGVFRPAPGFPKTLPDTDAWQDFTERCAATLETKETTLAYPDGGTIHHARGVPCNVDCVLVLLGGTPSLPIVERVRTAMPLLVALFVERHLREDVVAVVSHDLKNPLSSIVMATALLKGMGDSEESRERAPAYIDIIARAAENMNRLIGDLLDLASMESGTFAVSCTPHEVAPLLRESLDLFAPSATAKFLRLSCTTDGARIWVHCDSHRVSQILSNLIGNAIKFTPKGGSVRVDVEAIGAEARFSISDTGRGIPDEHLEHVFDRYWRGRRERRTGTGLGLSIAKGLVEAHGGRIWVESRVGKGTIFFFTLRSARAAIVEQERRPREDSIPPRRYRILVADDDKDLRESLCEFLEEAGYDVTGVKSGVDALERLQQADKPDLILFDLAMKGVNGWQFREVQQRDPELAAIPLLVMTSNRDLKDLPTDLDSVVYKPFRLEQLLGTIARRCEMAALVTPAASSAEAAAKSAVEP